MTGPTRGAKTAPRNRDERAACATFHRATLTHVPSRRWSDRFTMAGEAKTVVHGLRYRALVRRKHSWTPPRVPLIANSTRTRGGRRRCGRVAGRVSAACRQSVSGGRGLGGNVCIDPRGVEHQNLTMLLVGLALTFVPFLLLQFHCLDCGATGWLFRRARHACPAVVMRCENRVVRRFRGPGVKTQLIAWFILIASVFVLGVVVLESVP